MVPSINFNLATTIVLVSILAACLLSIYAAYLTRQIKKDGLFIFTAILIFIMMCLETLIAIGITSKENYALRLLLWTFTGGDVTLLPEDLFYGPIVLVSGISGFSIFCMVVPELTPRLVKVMSRARYGDYHHYS